MEAVESSGVLDVDKLKSAKVYETEVAKRSEKEEDIKKFLKYIILDDSDY